MNSILSVFMASGLITSLAVIARLIKLNPLEYFEIKETKDRVGALYKDFDTSSKHALYYGPFFLARRLFVAAVFVYVETIALKVELIVLSCFVSLYYLIMYKPYKDKLDFKIEIINEIGLLVANIWCLAFTDLLYDSPDEKIQQGWVYIIIIVIIISVNLFFFLKRTVYAFLKKWIIKSKAR